jgi:serine/threonine protein kinase
MPPAGATLLLDGALTRGRYRIEGELGRGGAGIVFAARDTALGRPIALKVYHRRGASERSRLRVEATTPAAMEHPGVIRVLDLDLTLSAIAMERIDAGSVRTRLRLGRVPVATALEWFRTAVDALSHVHARGVVHRDIKPSNLLLRRDDRVVLADFGLAARVGDAAQPWKGEGTLQYMPPEQRAALPAVPSADVYAVGATMTEVFEQVDGDPGREVRALFGGCTEIEPTRRPTLVEIARTLESR